MEFSGRVGSQKPKNVKQCTLYEAKLEFPEEWGVIREIASVGGGGYRYTVEVHDNLPWGGYGYFLEPHVTYLLYTSFNQSSMNWSYIKFAFTN